MAFEQPAFRFIAKDDEGNEYLIVGDQEIVEDRVRAGTTRTPGMKDMFTEAGERVNYVSKGQYEIEGLLGTISIFSDDPNAP